VARFCVSTDQSNGQIDMPVRVVFDGLEVDLIFGFRFGENVRSVAFPFLLSEPQEEILPS